MVQALLEAVAHEGEVLSQGGETDAGESHPGAILQGQDAPAPAERRRLRAGLWRRRTQIEDLGLPPRAGSSGGPGDTGGTGGTGRHGVPHEVSVDGREVEVISAEVSVVDPLDRDGEGLGSGIQGSQGIQRV